ncbi:MAG: hypothetical protein RL660_2149 [Bacteroidota bacterium]|jgi:hypothetical protein
MKKLFLLEMLVAGLLTSDRVHAQIFIDHVTIVNATNSNIDYASDFHDGTCLTQASFSGTAPAAFEHYAGTTAPGPNNFSAWRMSLDIGGIVAQIGDNAGTCPLPIANSVSYGTNGLVTWQYAYDNFGTLGLLVYVK